MNFLSYLWKKYKISKEKAKILQKMELMMQDHEKLTDKELNEKYEGNFGRAWALMQGKRLEITQKENRL